MDNVFAQIKTTELKGSTFRSRILDFGDFDISEAEFKIVFKRAGNILSFPDFATQKIDNRLVIPYTILQSYSGDIQMEAWMTLNGITDLALVDIMLISAENQLKSDATNQNISVTFGDVVIPVTFTQAIVNIGSGTGTGENGKSAYEIAVLNGFPGTEAEWLISLKGADGEDFTYEDFTPEQLALLKGDKGDSFEYSDFTPEQLFNLKGSDGISAYQIAINNGFVGTETEWLDSLKLNKKNRFKGKIISILGDSLSSFGTPTILNTEGNWNYPGNRCRYPNSDVLDVNDMYWKKLIDSKEMYYGVNESWAGSRVSWDGVTEGNDIGANKHIASMTRILHLGINGTPDVILVNAGTNDAGSSVTIGTFSTTNPIHLQESDMAGLPVNTFYNAYKTMICRLMFYYPNAEIIVMLPNFNLTHFNWSDLYNYSEAIIKVCTYFGIKYIDVRKSGISLFNYTEYLYDGLHPNKAGMNLIFEYLNNQFSYM